MRFVALERFPPDLPDAELREELAALAQCARDLGARAVEVGLDRATGRAVGNFVAPDADVVRRLHARAGVACDDVLPVERWWAELVDPPRT